MYKYKEGAKRESICSYCEKSVTSTLTKTTLSICKGLEEVENVIVNVCDECGNMISIPARSEPPIQQAYKEIVETGSVSSYDDLTVELKSIVDAKETSNRESQRDYSQECPQVAATG